MYNLVTKILVMNPPDIYVLVENELFGFQAIQIDRSEYLLFELLIF